MSLAAVAQTSPASLDAFGNIRCKSIFHVGKMVMSMRLRLHCSAYNSQQIQAKLSHAVSRVTQPDGMWVYGVRR